MAEDEQWWFCLNHHEVEGRHGCLNKDRLGPFPSQDAAAHALEKVKQRNEAWDDDPRWQD